MEPLTEKDWGELQNVLHGRDSKWQAIGIQLHVAHDELTRIRREHGQNLEQCNREMQIAWLKSGRATWRALVAALGAGPVGLHEDAKRLEEKHLYRTIQSAASARGSYGDLVECNPESKFLSKLFVVGHRVLVWGILVQVYRATCSFFGLVDFFCTTYLNSYK
jgi:hypothetical protein